MFVVLFLYLFLGAWLDRLSPRTKIYDHLICAKIDMVGLKSSRTDRLRRLGDLFYNRKRRAKTVSTSLTLNMIKMGYIEGFSEHPMLQRKPMNLL